MSAGAEVPVERVRAVRVTSQLRICPPANPISTRIESSATRNHLREDPAAGRNRDGRTRPRARTAPPRNMVDELRALRLELVESRAEVVCGERQVMHAGPRRARKRATGVSSPVGYELDTAVSDQHGRSLDALFAQRLAVLEACVEELLVGRDRLVEISHGEGRDGGSRARFDSTRRSCHAWEVRAPCRRSPTSADSGAVSASRAWSSERSSVSFSRSADATRSSAARCLERSRFDSS